MSRKVDEQVVSMQFDNRHFEKNVSTTMGTLDKLKSKLSFKDSTKSLDDLNKASKKTDMTPLARSVETVQAKFSALQIMGITALTNITNSAVNAGKRIVSALTIQPVTSGFREYEMKMDSVKTIMASTGEDIKKVNEYLNELNTYSDKTIYSFADMTQNIGKFTNAGVKLEDAVKAIQGISNEAAVSGANANEASRAMYNFAQALSSGYVKLIDWKSIELANMATVEFKTQLLESAVAAGTLTKASDGMYRTLSGETLSATKNFNDTLQEQWMTSEVLIETLKDYADENTEIGKKAFEAATKVTKLSQVFDILKETAQSGWARTWELIFGDLEQAKALFTPLTNFFSGIIDRMSDFRNRMLEALLGSPIGKLAEKISKISSAASTAAGKMKDLGDIVNRVINGEFGNAEPRWKKLTELGYDWAHVQNLVNEKLGNSYRRATTYKEGQEELTQATMELTDAQLRELGFTDLEIKAYRELEKESKRTGKSIQELAAEMDGMTGRERIVKSLAKLGNALKSAWRDIFPRRSEAQMNKMAESLSNFSKKLLMSDETADKLRRTFRGLFAALDIVLTIVAGPIKIAFRIFREILAALDIPFLSVTASIGDAIVKLRDFIDGIFDCSAVAEKLVPSLRKMIKGIKEWFAELKKSDNIPRDIVLGLVNGLRNGISLVASVVVELGKTIINTIKKILGIHSPSVVFFAIGGFLIAGLANGIAGGYDNILEGFIDFGAKLLDVVKMVFDKIINFVKGIDIGTIFAVALAAGVVVAVRKIINIVEMFGSLADGLGDLARGISHVADAVAERIKPNRFAENAKAILHLAIAIGILAASVYALSKLGRDELKQAVFVITVLAGIMGGLMAAAGKMKDKDGDVKKISRMILSLGASLWLIASAVKKLDFITSENFGPILAVMAGMIGGLYVLFLGLSKLTSAGTEDQLKQTAKMISKLSIAMLMLAITIRLISKLEYSALAKGILTIGLFGAFIVGLMAATKLMNHGRSLDGLGKTISKIAFAMILMTIVIKMVSGLEPSELTKGIEAISVFGLVIVGLMAGTRLASGNDLTGVGKTIMAVSGAMMLMGITVKICAGLSAAEMENGVKAIVVFGLIVVALIKATSIAKGKVAGIAGTIFAMSLSIALMAAVSIMLSLVSVEGLLKGVTAVTVLGLLMATMATSLRGVGDLKDTYKTIKAMTVTIGVMAAALLILSFIDPQNLATATIAITSIVLVLTLLVRSLKHIQTGAKTFQRTIITLGVLTLVIALLAQIMGKMAKDIKNPEALVPSAAGIGLLLLAMSASLAIIDSKKTLTKEKMTRAMAMFTVMTILIGALGLVLIAVSQWGNPNAIMESAKSLAVMAGAMLAMTGVMAALAAINKYMGKVSPAALVKITVVFGIVIAIITAFVTVIATILGLLAKIDGFKETLNAGIDLMVDIFGGIGRMVGAIIGGVAEGIAESLPNIAKSLSAFMTELQPFIDGLTNIKPEVIQAAATLAGAIITLTAASLLDGLTSFLTFGEGGLESFAENLGALGKGMSDFSKKVENVNIIKVTTAAMALEVLSKAAENIPNSGGLLGLIVGENDIDEFGEKLPVLGEGIADFSTAVENVKPDKVKAAASALTELAKAADKIPNSGGLLGLIVGENDVDEFGEKLPKLGEGLAGFSKEVSAEAFNNDSIKAAAESVVHLAKAADKIPNSGGWLGAIVGENDIDDFGDMLPALGEGLAGFSEHVSAEAFNNESIKAAAESVVHLAQAAVKIPNSGGWISLLVGNNDIDDFGRRLPILGEGLAGFSKAVSAETFDADKISAAASAAQEIAKMTQHIPKADGITAWFGQGSLSVINFIDQLVPLGQGLAGFGREVAGMPAEVSMAAKAASAIADLTNSIPNEKGMEAWIVGKTSIAQFIGLLPEFGAGLTAFAESVQGMPTTNIDAAKKAADTISQLSNINKPNKDGMESWIATNKEGKITAFGSTLESIGQCMGEMMSVMDDYSFDPERVAAAADAFASMMSALGNIAGQVKGLSDTGAAASYAALIKALFFPDSGDSVLKEIGKGMHDFAIQTNAIAIDSGKLSDITDAFGVITGTLVNLSDANFLNIGQLIPQISSLGEALVKFVNGDGTTDGISAIAKGELSGFSQVEAVIKSWSGLDSTSLDSVTTSVGDFLDTITKFNDVDSEDTSGVTSAISSIKDAIDDLVSEDSDTYAKVQSIGTTMLDAIESGLLNETDLESLKTTLSTLVGTTLVTASKSETISASWNGVGKFVVDGIAKGITDNESTGTAAATSLASAMIKAAKEEFDEHSPSRVFAEIGKYGVLGLVKGFADTSGEAEDASVGLADGVLKAFQDRLEIHSPSLVMTKQGTYIVQGIAEGIEKDMSAEEAAEKKAQNIIDAFQKVFDRYDAKIDFNEAEAELKKSSLGAYADEEKVAEIDRETLQKNLSIRKEKEKYYENLYNVTKEQYEKGEVFEQQLYEAATLWTNARTERQEAENAINEGEFDKLNSQFDRQRADAELNKTHRSTWRDTWLAENGKDLTKDQISDYMVEELSKDLIDDNKILEIETNRHAQLLDFATRMYGTWDNFPQTVKDMIESAWASIQEATQQTKATQNEINSYLLGNEQRDVEDIEKAMNRKQSKFDTYMELHGDDLTPEETDNLNKALERDKIDSWKKQLVEEQDVLEQIAKDYGIYSDEYEAQVEKMEGINDDIARSDKRIRDIEEDAAERRRERAKEKNDLAMERIDLDYNLWETTLGRDATTAEKNTAKLASLSQKVTVQSSALQIAYKEWQEAADEYGRSSNEAQTAYNEYLNTQLDLVNLQNEILDIEEQTVERQKLAKSDYNDYMKTYAKYYELNGMSRAQLEKDARLVSGYDPNATVNSIFDSTKNALENVQESSKYAELMEGFSNVGTSYVGAVNDGVTNTASLIEDSIISMLETCLTGVKSDTIKNKWIETGKFIVEGFVKGIRDNITLAAQAAAAMAHEASKAARAEFDINSPSRVFAEIGMFAVKGLVKGFDDNAYLSDNAASNLGKRAIDNLKESLSRIYETVDSEIDTQPTIRPVLDLSNVESKAAKLNAMLSRDMAMGISASMSRGKDNTAQNGVDNTKGVNNYNFTQNNYSPKALSNSEIYRQTKNQFAALKGALG